MIRDFIKYLDAIILFESICPKDVFGNIDEKYIEHINNLYELLALAYPCPDKRFNLTQELAKALYG